MKIILDKPVFDRQPGIGLLEYEAGKAYEFPDKEAERLVDREVAHAFPKNKEEDELLKKATVHPKLEKKK